MQTNFRVRHSFGKIHHVVEVPNLIDIQKRSYEKFLQANVPQAERKDIGLQGVFKSIFPVRDFDGKNELIFIGYNLEKPPYDVEECIQRGMNYAAPIKVQIELHEYQIMPDGQKRAILINPETVYFGDIPLMTENGTFIINGTERVVVSQLHRSPGVVFDHDKGKTHASGKKLYQARVIPYHGSWLDFEFDPKDLIYVRIDRRRKMLATVLLKALGYSAQDMLNFFYKTELLYLEKGKSYSKKIDYDLLGGQRVARDIKVDGEVIVKKHGKFTKAAIRKLKEAKLERLPLDITDVIGKISAQNIVDGETGEAVISVNEEITEAKLEKIRDAKIPEIKVLFIDGTNVGSYLRDTLNADKVTSQNEAILEIYRRLRPGDQPSLETAKQYFQNLFFNPERYDLSEVGRFKLNDKFYADSDKAPKMNVLTHDDILFTVRHLIDLKTSGGDGDDIDHLGNRRVRAVGELMENQYRIGLKRMERQIKEKMGSTQESEHQKPHELMNTRPVSAVIKEYFGSSQLSQFMDQTNPLSEVTHKRRLSALGPGGLTRERAGFEVRDVHPTHYGRICPIETPEGANIGLIASLATYARVNEFGFVETPYRKVENGKISSDVKWYSALEEEGHFIAQANSATDAKTNTLLPGLVSSRHNGEFIMVPREQITLMDVGPNQIVSVAASLIPFLEHDDANRALMGSNMQRQAVPLLKSTAPVVGTGMEAKVARDSGVCLVAKRDGVVESVDASRVVVRSEGEGGVFPDIYRLQKFHRSNQSTSYTQKPTVRTGEKVKVGDVIADGPSCDLGELALGRNAVVAFMPWMGYNFEDSILISERVVKEDIFTSIHIEEFECIARETKQGPEEITHELPNVAEEAVKDLDESGVVRIGAEVKAGDILVGKITPKGETQQSPEEKLLRAIFGEKAGDVKDSSLRVPPGVAGVVINARVYARRNVTKDDRAKEIEDAERSKFEKDMADEVKIIREAAYSRLRKLIVGKTAMARLVDDKGKTLISKGNKIDAETLDPIARKYWKDIEIDKGQEKIESIFAQLQEQVKSVEGLFSDKIKKLSKEDQLPPGVIKMIKVYVAIKRKLQVGDKMAGRHGNKGVVSRILREEDMPYLPDGTPVDVVLSPLGVPSRMNVGQILEVHLGWAGLLLGKQISELLASNKLTGEALRKHFLKIYAHGAIHTMIQGMEVADLESFATKLKHGLHLATPVFDGAEEKEIKRLLQLVNETAVEYKMESPLYHMSANSSGQTTLFDGRTGDPFDRDVTVGVMYMLKLHHLVDDKIHARSTGPYSLVTQQPLGGKAQFGGQRLGEMEVWAMEAYGAAYALQEFLTVKSDDVQGRTRMYEGIVKGDYTLDSGIPESFNVLMKELQALCLNIELVNDAPANTGLMVAE